MKRKMSVNRATQTPNRYNQASDLTGPQLENEITEGIGWSANDFARFVQKKPATILGYFKHTEPGYIPMWVEICLELAKLKPLELLELPRMQLRKSDGVDWTEVRRQRVMSKIGRSRAPQKREHQIASHA